MHNKTRTWVATGSINAVSFLTLLAFITFLSLLACILIPVSALENDDVLVNGSGMYLTTGESWPFYQGYELVFKGLSSNKGENKVWVELLLNGESMDDTIIHEGEYFVYTRNSKEIFNITVDTIYSGSEGGLITFKPVYQYLDPTLPEPDMMQDPESVDTSNGSVNNSGSSNDDVTEDTSGFGAMLFFLCMSAAAIFKVWQKKNR